MRGHTYWFKPLAPAGWISVLVVALFGCGSFLCAEPLALKLEALQSVDRPGLPLFLQVTFENISNSEPLSIHPACLNWESGELLLEVSYQTHQQLTKDQFEALDTEGQSEALRALLKQKQLSFEQDIDKLQDHEKLKAFTQLLNASDRGFVQLVPGGIGKYWPAYVKDQLPPTGRVSRVSAILFNFSTRSFLFDLPGVYRIKALYGGWRTADDKLQSNVLTLEVGRTEGFEAAAYELYSQIDWRFILEGSAENLNVLAEVIDRFPSSRYGEAAIYLLSVRHASAAIDQPGKTLVPDPRRWEYYRSAIQTCEKSKRLYGETALFGPCLLTLAMFDVTDGYPNSDRGPALERLETLIQLDPNGGLGKRARELRDEFELAVLDHQ